MSDDETLRVYAQKVSEYEAMVAAAPLRDPLLSAFIADLPEAAEVLDLGCGPGHFAAAIAAAGHHVTATDAVPEMVERADRHAGVTARRAAFDEIDGQDIYDGIWANFSLLHAPRDAMPMHLSALHRALRPKGLFHIALKAGEGSRRDALGRHYTYYTDAELSGVVEAAGFTITDRARGREKGLDGTPADWIAVRAYG